MTPNELGRFEAKVERVTESGCWIWMAGLDTGGYGQFRIGKMRGAHRVAFEHYRRLIPAGYHLDHLCRVRSCVNPNHLEVVTSRENIRRSPIQITTRNSKKTTCPNGHPLAWGNLRLSVLGRKKDAGRLCLTCHRVYQREWMRRWRAKQRVTP